MYIQLDLRLPIQIKTWFLFFLRVCPDGFLAFYNRKFPFLETSRFNSASISVSFDDPTGSKHRHSNSVIYKNKEVRLQCLGCLQISIIHFWFYQQRPKVILQVRLLSLIINRVTRGGGVKFHHHVPLLCSRSGRHGVDLHTRHPLSPGTTQPQLRPDRLAPTRVSPPVGQSWCRTTAPPHLQEREVIRISGGSTLPLRFILLWKWLTLFKGADLDSESISHSWPALCQRRNRVYGVYYSLTQNVKGYWRFETLPLCRGKAEVWRRGSWHSSLVPPSLSGRETKLCNNLPLLCRHEHLSLTIFILSSLK